MDKWWNGTEESYETPAYDAFEIIEIAFFHSHGEKNLLTDLEQFGGSLG